MNEKIHKETPITRCRTKRIDSNKKIKLQGTFKASVNIENISDETVPIENDGSWATLSDGSEQTETINEVFKTATSEYSGSKEQILSSPEKSRCSETHRSLWSLDHLFEDSDHSTTDGWVKDILSTPEKCTSSDSDGRPEKEVFCSTRYDSPKLSVILSDFKELGDLSSIPNVIYCKDADQKHHNHSKLESKLLGKNRVTKKCSGKINFPKVKRKNASQIKKTEQDLQSKNSFQVLLEPEEMPTILQSFRPSGEIKETIPQTINKEDLGETPKGIKVKHPRRKVLQNRRLRTKKIQRTILPNLRRTNATKLSKSNQNTFQVNSSDSLCSTVIAEPCSAVPLQLTSFHENYKAPSLSIPRENADPSLKSTVINDRKHSMVTSAAKLVKKKKGFQKRKFKDDFLKEKSISAANSSVSTKDLVIQAESGESIKSHSIRISEKNSDKPLEGTFGNADDDSWNIAVPKLMKNKKSIFKRKSIEESLEDEIISTPSSTVITEDFIEVMDTSSSSVFSDENSENSEEKFLEEMGLYESDSSIEIDQPKLNRKNNSKNRHRKSEKDSWESKSLSEKIREYKEYLKTIPICDLSLKKWRVEKQNRKV